jgi:pimeloyl-ACP methyl ester carboxylesterase
LTERWIDRESARIYYDDDGVGPAVVILHGPMATRAAVKPLAETLRGRCRVITPDVRGNGRSHYHGTISFDMLVDDILAILQDAGVARAIVGGMSGGAGIALRLALTAPAHVVALFQVTPFYAGTAVGQTEAQRSALLGQYALIQRAVGEGRHVLRPLYEALPERMRAGALAALEEMDLKSMEATSRFLISGLEPFDSPDDLASITTPTFLIPGDDAMHPRSVSDLYARYIPRCKVTSFQEVAAEMLETARREP